MGDQADQDCYAVLGVPMTASEREIRAAYRKLARRFHPDLNAGDKNAAEHFKRIKAAYETLSDPERRRRYDELRTKRTSSRRARRAQTVAGARDQPHLVKVRRSGGRLAVEVGLGLSNLLDLTVAVRLGAQRPADGE
ncbi:MAG TPA: J domain-containing protein [Chloroflexota bacterium]|jgi:curved DNA-binding protein CbpA|nr:J domain-containing protein [Chloroflexota bacterium]